MSRTLALVLVLWVGSLAPSTAHGQSSFDLFGSARADALANGTTADPAAVGVHANPAARADVATPTAVFYARQSFGLAALRYGASHVVAPLDWGTASIGASTFGFDEYREIHASAGYARSLPLGTARRIHLGATLRYYHTAIAEYGNAAAFGINLGFIVSLIRSLRLGAHASNVNGATLVNREPIPRTLAVGLRYDALSRVTVMVDAFKDVRFPATLRGGLEVRPVSPLALRAGITTAPVRFTAGAGVRLGLLCADLALEQHQVLGWSPSASLRVQW